MKSIYKIIKEECREFLREYYDIEDEFFTKEDEIKEQIFTDFLYNNNNNFTKPIPWTVIPFARLKKIWEDYMSTGVVRDTRGLEMIEDIMIKNTIKVNIIIILLGHTSSNPDDDYEEYIGGYVDEQIKCIREKKVDVNQLEIPFNDPQKGYQKKNPENYKCKTTVNPFLLQFIEENQIENLNDEDLRIALYDMLSKQFSYYYTEDPKSGQAYISDYGLNPLLTLLSKLMYTTKPEEKVVVIDKMLNVIHQRSDIASWFVEGGSRALSALSGYSNDKEDSVISGSYKMSDYR